MSQNSLLNVSNNELEIIEFIIDEKQPDGKVYSGHYGINVAKVLEIIRLPNITSVPSKCDPSVLGTFNLRGKVLPVGGIKEKILAAKRAGITDTNLTGHSLRHHFGTELVRRGAKVAAPHDSHHHFQLCQT